jgi:hypothetical protein
MQTRRLFFPSTHPDIFHFRLQTISQAHQPLHSHTHTTSAARCASKSLVCTLVCMPADELTSFGPLDTTAIRTRISGQCSSGATWWCDGCGRMGSEKGAMRMTDTQRCKKARANIANNVERESFFSSSTYDGRATRATLTIKTKPHSHHMLTLIKPHIGTNAQQQ